MGQRRKRESESVGCAILLLLGMAAFLHSWNIYGNIVVIVVAVIIALAFAGIVFNVIEKEKRIRALRLADVDIMNGVGFERYVGRLLEHRGFQVEMTKVSGDLGVDIVAQKDDLKYAIQVKRYDRPVSRRAISDAVAGKDPYNCNAAMVVTNTYFTKGAVKLAHSTGCEMVDRDALAEWILDFQFAKTATEPRDKSSAHVDNAKVGLYTKLMSRPLLFFTLGQWLLLALLGISVISVFGFLLSLLVWR